MAGVLLAGLLAPGWGTTGASEPTSAAATEAALGPWSEAAVAEGLSVEVRLVKARIVEGEAPEFVVALKNVSGEPYQLWNATFDWTYSWQIGNWAAEQRMPQAVPAGPAARKVLKPGESLEAKVGVGAATYIWVSIRPEPMVRPRTTLPVGEYDVFAIATFDRDGAAGGGGAGRYWTGRVTSKPVRLVVVARPAGTEPGTRAAVSPPGK